MPDRTSTKLVFALSAAICFIGCLALALTGAFLALQARRDAASVDKFL